MDPHELQKRLDHANQRIGDLSQKLVEQEEAHGSYVLAVEKEKRAVVRQLERLMLDLADLREHLLKI